MSNSQEANENWKKCHCGGWVHWHADGAVEVATHRFDLDKMGTFHSEAWRYEPDFDFYSEWEIENVLPSDATEEQHKEFLRELFQKVQEAIHAPDQD